MSSFVLQHLWMHHCINALGTKSIKSWGLENPFDFSCTCWFPHWWTYWTAPTCANFNLTLCTAPTWYSCQLVKSASAIILSIVMMESKQVASVTILQFWKVTSFPRQAFSDLPQNLFHAGTFGECDGGERGLGAVGGFGGCFVSISLSRLFSSGQEFWYLLFTRPRLSLEFSCH